MSNRTPVELLSVLLTARVAAVVGDGGVPEGVLLVLCERLVVAVRHGASALLELGLQHDANVLLEVYFNFKYYVVDVVLY